ncbi:MAG: heavy metal translocating P-type ATPase [Pseudonocardiales bacterium]|nr:heavy metal translocating P-type ATPase [Pseudonocardiales bacterium]
MSGVVTDRPAALGADGRERRETSGISSMFTLAEVRWATVATVLFAVGGIAQLAGAPAVVWWTLYLACYVTGGWEPALAGLRALLDKTLDVDLLMIVAAIIAASIGQVLDGALLIVIFSTSGALEALATKRTADSVRALLHLTPDVATRLVDGTEEVVAADQLAVGDIVLVRPGERIGADGTVLSGASEVDQASITGEPLPVLKETGDEVFAGTLNGTGALRVQVDRDATDSVVARIVALVEEASATKAKTQLFIEKVEQRYSVGMVTATVLLFAIPMLFGAELQSTLLRAMTFMIVASPCAVVLATMPPLLSAIANAGRHRLLVKSAVVMEHLGTVQLVAFDKTGTLTEGAPRVTGIHAIPSSGYSDDDVLGYAASAERPSEHPLASAIVLAAHDRRLALDEADDFDSTPGRGVTSKVRGRIVRVGSPVILSDVRQSADLDAIDAATRLIQAAELEGRTAVVVLVDDSPIGVLDLTDGVRADSADVVLGLTALTGRTPILLTGDNERAAKRLAADVGLDEVYAGLLPAQKVEHVRRLQQDGTRLLLVGDGVNDAPAMAAADVGFAMGRRGSDLALETSDAVIVSDELDTVPRVIVLARRARRLVIANLVIAGTVITCLVAWDLIGHLPLPLGVAGHEGSTVIVGLNGLRLLRSSAWRRAKVAR